jgi:hypothetical protein
MMFENRVPLLAGATFSEEDGDPVLVLSGGLEDVRYLPAVNAFAFDDPGVGQIRDRVALVRLARQKFLELDRSGGTVRIRLGERARKPRKGKQANAVPSRCAPASER